MASPVLELTAAIVARLKGWAGLSGLVGTRVYDTVSASAVFPYVSLGPIDELSDDAECIPGSEIFLQIDAWSRAVGRPEVLRVAEEVKAALHEYAASLATNALVSLEWQRIRALRDPDGVTHHAVIEFRAFVERP